MNTKIQNTVIRRDHPILTWSLHILLGSLFLVGCSQIEVPIGPVPVTLQTLGVFLLALFQGSQKSFLSTCLYLGAATVALPVLSGWSANPLWMVGPCGGYLISFPIAAYVIGKLTEKQKHLSYLHIIFSLGMGQIITYLLGFLWLSIQFGVKIAIMTGVVPFLWPAVLKVFCAASLKKGVVQWQHQ